MSGNDLHEALDRLSESHYYAEEWEFQAAARAWNDALDPAAQALFPQVLWQRVERDPSVTNASLCVVFPFPELEIPLAAALSRQPETSHLTRSLIAALQWQRGDAAFRAVERFIDSAQEMEALLALVRIHPDRAVPYMRRAVMEDRLIETCLHALAQLRATSGMEAAVGHLKSVCVGEGARLLRRVRAMFAIKTVENSPFSPDEIRHMLGALHPGGMS